MPKSKFFMFCYATILILLIIWLMTRVQFLFKPFVVAFQTLFLPFLLAGVLYFLIRPIIDYLSLKKVPRVLSILGVFLVFIGVIAAAVYVLAPILYAQINRLIDNAPEIATMLQEQWHNFQHTQDSLPEFVDDWIETATAGAQSLLHSIGRNMGNILGSIASFLLALVIVPFILFYMLKDGHSLSDGISRFLPSSNRQEAKAVLSDMSKAIHTYVMGQAIVSLFVGVMVYIWYVIIGLEYSLVLALVAMFTNLIPFVGPFIGTAPAVIVGLIDSPWMMVKVLIGVIIVQQIESNLVSPQVMGRVLDVHPLTIILLILVGGSLAGILGLILAVPLYAVVKVVIKHAVRLYQLRHTEQ